MSMSEKAAYLKGLADGIKLDDGKDTDRLLKAIIDTIAELSDVVDDIDEDLDVFSEQLDAVDEDLGELEEYVYEGNCGCNCGCDCDCDCDCDCGCGCGDDCDEEEFYDVTCPECGETVCVDDEILDEGSIECPNCGTLLEFDFDCDCDDCGCEDCEED